MNLGEEKTNSERNILINISPNCSRRCFFKLLRSPTPIQLGANFVDNFITNVFIRSGIGYCKLIYIYLPLHVHRIAYCLLEAYCNCVFVYSMYSLVLVRLSVVNQT